ncbi:MAG: hypothetical protein AAFR51_08365 [Pseudomonadota bacterium]
MKRAHALFLMLLAFSPVSCSLPEGCPGNCQEVCAGQMFEANQCGTDYAHGFSVGYCAGVLNIDKREENQAAPFIAGYWDGYSQGSYLRLDWFMKKCTNENRLV